MIKLIKILFWIMISTLVTFFTSFGFNAWYIALPYGDRQEDFAYVMSEMFGFLAVLGYISMIVLICIIFAKSFKEVK